MNSWTLSKIANFLFYLALIFATLYFLKRKFIVPQLDTNQLVFQDYSTKQQLDFQSFPNKIIVLNFWQTWCGPCIQELPSLNKMSILEEDIIVLAISDEPLEKIQAYQMKYPNIVFLKIENFSSTNITQFPTTYIYNKSGTKVFSHIGSKNWADKEFIFHLKKNWDN
jgi:cytochrome c biogenesis protein CcmG/thiol:disulfide interchange protein DsbE